MNPESEASASGEPDATTSNAENSPSAPKEPGQSGPRKGLFGRKAKVSRPGRRPPAARPGRPSGDAQAKSGEHGTAGHESSAERGVDAAAGEDLIQGQAVTEKSDASAEETVPAADAGATEQARVGGPVEVLSAERNEPDDNGEPVDGGSPAAEGEAVEEVEEGEAVEEVEPAGQGEEVEEGEAVEEVEEGGAADAPMPPVATESEGEIETGNAPSAEDEAPSADADEPGERDPISGDSAEGDGTSEDEPSNEQEVPVPADSGDPAPDPEVAASDEDESSVESVEENGDAASDAEVTAANDAEVTATDDASATDEVGATDEASTTDEANATSTDVSVGSNDRPADDDSGADLSAGDTEPEPDSDANADAETGDTVDEADAPDEHSVAETAEDEVLPDVQSSPPGELTPDDGVEPSGQDESAGGDASSATESSADEDTSDATSAATETQDPGERVLSIQAVTKEFGSTRAVADVSLDIPAGAIFGLVGPNGAGKTTLLSIITGLLRPDSGTIQVNGHDVWADPEAAKRVLGVLPDRLRLFDRLTGRQLLHYSGTLRGLDKETVRKRSAELAAAFGLEDALGRLVSDYSAGMTKKVALAASMIHSPRILVLDEPFEGVDPVSSQTVIDILERFVAAGGTVLLSSHSMETIERICTGVAIIVHGEILAQGTVEDVSSQGSLEERFLELAGGDEPVESMEWLLSSSG